MYCTYLEFRMNISNMKRVRITSTNFQWRTDSTHLHFSTKKKRKNFSAWCVKYSNKNTLHRTNVSPLASLWKGLDFEQINIIYVLLSEENSFACLCDLEFCREKMDTWEVGSGVSCDSVNRLYHIQDNEVEDRFSFGVLLWEVFFEIFPLDYARINLGAGIQEWQRILKTRVLPFNITGSFEVPIGIQELITELLKSNASFTRSILFFKSLVNNWSLSFKVWNSDPKN